MTPATSPIWATSGIVAGILLCSCGKAEPELGRVRFFDGGPVHDAREIGAPPGRPVDDVTTAVPDGPIESGIDASLVPFEGGRCEGVDRCPGHFAPVSIPVSTPRGSIVFDHAWLSYTLGFGVTTTIMLTVGDGDASRPTLFIGISGNPIEGGGEPGPHESNVTLETCDSQYLETKGTLYVVLNEAAKTDAGTYSARLEASAVIASAGWHLDAHFVLTDVCGVWGSN
jgi:hypothetical protein